LPSSSSSRESWAAKWTTRPTSESRFADAFENAPHAMILIATDGALLNANRAFRRMLGFTGCEIATLSVDDVIHPDDLATDTEQRYRLACGGAARYELVLRYVRKNRETIWVRTSVSAAGANSAERFCFVAQSERAASARIAERADLPGISLSRYNDATLSAIHEIGNCLTPLMVNTEMIVEQCTRSDVGELALQIFNAARRIAFTLRRLRPIDEHQSVAYLGQDRLLDLRIVAPPSGPILERVIGDADEVPHRSTGSAATFFPPESGDGGQRSG
jgi:PAS domain S-box-containing protein